MVYVCSSDCIMHVVWKTLISNELMIVKIF